MVHKLVHRRAIWQPTPSTRLLTVLKHLKTRITFPRLLIAVFVLPILFYVFNEVTRDVLVIEPFTVPKRFQDSGLTGEVMANRIGDALSQIETATQTYMRKDALGSIHDEDFAPAIEIPGTKLGLKTAIDLTRTIFGLYPKHISGDMVISATEPSSRTTKVIVTFYVTQGRKRSTAVSLTVCSADDAESLVQRTAEAVLRQINPYVLAAHFSDNNDQNKVIELCRQLENEATNRIYKIAAFNLWGIALQEQGKNDEAIAKYQKALELNPKFELAYNGWGNALQAQGKNDEAEKHQESEPTPVTWQCFIS